MDSKVMDGLKQLGLISFGGKQAEIEKSIEWMLNFAREASPEGISEVVKEDSKKEVSHLLDLFEQCECALGKVTEDRIDRAAERTIERLIRIEQSQGPSSELNIRNRREGLVRDLKEVLRANMTTGRHSRWVVVILGGPVLLNDLEEIAALEQMCNNVIGRVPSRDDQIKRLARQIMTAGEVG